MSDKMREALRAAYLAGSQYGHNATVEGFWADDPDIASDYVDEALAGHLAQPDGQCSYCRTYNGHHDGCIYVPPAPSEQPAQGEAVAEAEVESMIGRLLSSDVDFIDCEDAVDLIRRLAAPSAPAVPDSVARVVRAARHYFEHYAQDEADDVEDCVCGEDQHRAARELRDALAAAPEVPRG